MIGRLRLDRPVLVVDDTNSTRYSTCRILRAAGAEVLEATTGREALALSPSCGAVVLDVNLPDMDGFSVCLALRSSEAFQHIPIVHLSAQRLRDEDRVRGLEAGADAYLTHPVEPGVLIATLNALLRIRAAEQSESLTRARFEAVFRTAPIGIALVASDGRLLETNAELERMLGATGSPLQGLDDLPEALGQGLARYRAREEDDHWRSTIMTAAGPDAPVHVDCRATRIGPDTTLLLVVDNTKRRVLEIEREELLERERRARAEAENASRAKDAFLALLSHELRNPLAPISSAAQLLQMAPGDEARVRSAGDIIMRQVRHMTELVDDLLDVSRVTRGLVQLDMEPVRLHGVIDNAIEQARPLMDTRGHALAVEAGPSAACVRGDRTRLVQVIANLLNNAAKYTPPGGRIELAVEQGAGSVQIRIRDNGTGISPTLLPHVFDLFTQGERTPDRSEGGLGIGLALVRSMVQLHGGRVEAHSAGVGQGSTFSITLPLIETGCADAAARPEAVRASSRASRRVMVVDDNCDAARTLADLLRLEGHDVTVMHEAAEALAALDAAGRFDVFVLDIGLPGMTGYELASALRAHPAASAAVLVALTGYGQAHHREESQRAGFDHHLVKPVDVSQLLAIVDSASDVRAAPAPSPDVPQRGIA